MDGNNLSVFARGISIQLNKLQIVCYAHAWRSRCTRELNEIYLTYLYGESL